MQHGSRVKYLNNQFSLLLFKTRDMRLKSFTCSSSADTSGLGMSYHAGNSGAWS